MTDLELQESSKTLEDEELAPLLPEDEELLKEFRQTAEDKGLTEDEKLPF